MPPTYTTTQAAQQLAAIGVTPSTIRNYCRDPRFQPYLSAGAWPQAGHARRLTADDLRAIAFIHQQSNAGDSLDEIAQRLQAGELADYVLDEGAPEAPPGALQLAVQSMASQLEATQQQNQDLTSTVQELNAALIDAARALARAESRQQAQQEEIDRLHALLGDELDRLRAQQPRPGFLRRIFGRK